MSPDGPLTRINDRIETALTGFARFFFRHPLAALATLVLLAGIGLAGAKQIARDGSIEGFFHPDAPEITAYADFRRQFGQDGQIVIGVQSQDLFTAANLRRLADLHRALAQEVPFVEDITSLYNTRAVVGGEGLFVVNDLLAHFLIVGDTSPKAVADFRAQVMAHPLYRGLVISDDATMTLLTIRPQRFRPQMTELLDGAGQDLFAQLAGAGEPGAKAELLSQAEVGQMAQVATEVAQRFTAADFAVQVAGAPVAATEIVRLLSSDMPKFTLISLLVIGAIVALFTRRLSATLAFGLVVVVSTLLTFAAMTALGAAIKPPTQILPSIIIVAAACAVLHLISALAMARAQGPAATALMPERACKERALAQAMRHAAVPIVFTSVTTAAGLVSFAGAKLAPVADLGLFGGLAVMIVLGVSLIAVPLMFRAFRFAPKAGKAAAPMLPGALALAHRIAQGAAQNSREVLLITATITVLAGLGLQGLRFHHNSLEWLPRDNAVRVATETIDAQMHGTINLEAVIDTGAARGVQQAALIGALDRIEADLPGIAAAQGVQIGKVFGVTDLLREVHRALDPDAPAPLPQGAMVAREFLLFENSASNDLPDFVDSRYSRTRMTIRLPWLEAGEYARLIDRIEEEIAQSLEHALGPRPGPDQTEADLPKVVLTGNMALLAQTSVNVIGAMAQGYLISLAAIAGLMMLTMGGLRLGLAAMLPNLVPVVIALGVMGYAGIPLDSFTMLIGTIALGIIVDDTIHLFHQLRRAEAEGRTGLDALDFAVGHSFVPIIATSLAVMAGFSAYAFSSMSNVVAFGLLTALISALGLAADMVLSPAIYAALGPRRDAPPRDTPPADKPPAAATPAPV